MQRTWLPARPLRLHRGKQAGGVVLVALMLAIAGAMAYVAVDAVLDLGRIEREQAIWDAGTVGARPTVAVRSHDRLVVSYDLDVGYADGDGVYQTQTLQFSVLGLGIDTSHEPIVRFDPGEPSHFALSWAIAARDGRWRYAVFGGAAFGLAALLALWAAVALVRAMSRQRALARSGDDAAVVVVSIKRRDGRQAHLFDVAWRADTSEQPVRITVIDSRRGTVAWLDGGSTALALVSADRTRGMLLRSDLHPLRLTARERAEIVARLEAAGGGAVRGQL